MILWLLVSLSQRDISILVQIKSWNSKAHFVIVIGDEFTITVLRRIKNVLRQKYIEEVWPTWPSKMKAKRDKIVPYKNMMKGGKVSIMTNNYYNLKNN